MTWCVPVLMQGAEIRELTQGLERGCQPARPAASRAFLRLTCSVSPRSVSGSAVIPSHHAQKGPEPSCTPAHSHSVLF